MKKYIFMFILLITLFPSIVKAACSNSEIIKLRSLASNINIVYEPIENNNNVTFNIILNNLNSNLKIRNLTKGETYSFKGEELVITGYKPGEKISFRIYADNGNCTDSIDMRYITLPNYNPYHNDKLCKELKNYKLCQKWTSVTLSYEEFINEINEYKLSLKSNKINEEEVDGLFDIIFNFYSKYYYIINGLLIIILLPLIIKNRDKISYFRR